MLDLITQTRSFRRFAEDKRISGEVIEDLINLARLGGSARNCQPWQFMGITDRKLWRTDFSLSCLGRVSERLERP